VIFISYARDPRVDTLAVTLRRHGLTVWRDKDSLRDGDPTEEQIRAALAECDAAIVWIGGGTLASPYVCNKELPVIFKEHERRGLRIVPLFVDCSAHEGIDQVRQHAGHEIGNHNGHERGANEVELWLETVAGSEVRRHLEQRRGINQRPVLRLVTRSDAADGKGDADLNLDWIAEYPATGELPDDAKVAELQRALGAVASSVRAVFGAGDVYLHLKCHLHIAAAVGFEFRRVTGDVPAVFVGGSWWRCRALDLAADDGIFEFTETGPATAERSALELSISRDIRTDVAAYVRTTTGYRRRHRLEPEAGVTQTGVTEHTCNAWAERAAKAARQLCGEPGVTGIDIFVAAPIAFAVGLGWRLNAVGGTAIYHPEGNAGPYRRVWKLPES
jgi:hypothetical protein